SAMGIGALLEDGIGDTIRVSLTEDSVHEIPAAYTIVTPYNDRLPSGAAPRALPVQLRSSTLPLPQESRNPYGYRRRVSQEVPLGDLQVGGAHPVRVEFAVPGPLHDVAGTLEAIRQLTTPTSPGAPVCEVVRLHARSAADLEAFTLLRHQLLAHRLTVPLALRLPWEMLTSLEVLPEAAKLIFTPESALPEEHWQAQVVHSLDLAQRHGTAIEWSLSPASLPAFLQTRYGRTLEGLAQTAGRLSALSRDLSTHGTIVSLEVEEPVAAYRFVAAHLDTLGLAVPLHLQTPDLQSRDETLFQAAIWLGTLLSDGLGDSLHIPSDCPAHDVLRLSYNILQAARLRMSKTEFISCPSCGRTLFNLQTTTERIKARMSHLKDVKIAIMGCIVNGPGEMADADFGYVGSGPGKISLYVGKECVERNIPEQQADERLIQLMHTHGKWVEPA
ncbi:MAG: flavodoxin-dependent (E)-4-hydroxy-3-methylbut-2-enyl-diphosphate synthase, partial [Candidatus Tectimicrobiota bacterium]